MSLGGFIQRGSRTQQQGSDANANSPGRELGRGIADGAVIALTIAKNSTDWIPLVKNVIGGVCEVIDLCRQFRDNKDAWKEFSDDLEDLRESIEERLPADDTSTPPDGIIHEVQKLASALEAISTKVVKMKNRSGLLKRLQVREDPKKIAEFRQLISERLQKFLVMIAIRSVVSTQTSSDPPAETMTLDFSTTLPPIPVHFYGRDQYVQDAVDKLLEKLTRKQSANLAIMGPGGIGKTSVASAILHHPAIKAHFGSYIFFVSCEAIITSTSLAAAVMKVLGLSLGDGDITKNFLTSMSNYQPPAILCLDNFETPWDSEDNQAVSKLILHLTSLQSFTILLTMRGTEIPALHKVDWIQMTNLGTLGEDEAMKAFLAIAQLVQENNPCLRELIRLLDCVPLAITLVARQCSTSKLPIPRITSLWKEQRVMSRGSNKDDNLGVSIELSLNSRKMKVSPCALRLLTILSHHPNGIGLENLPLMVSMSEEDLDEAVYLLQSTSLSFLDDDHLRMLTPIRLYILHNKGLLPTDERTLQQYYFDLTANWRTTVGTAKFVKTREALDSEWGNVCSLLLGWLHDTPGNEEVLECILSATGIMQNYIPDASLVQEMMKVVTSQTIQHSRCLQSLGDIFRMQSNYSAAGEKLEEARFAFTQIGDKFGAAQCLKSLGNILRMQSKYSVAEEKLKEARIAFTQIGDKLGAAQCLKSLGDILRMQSNYSAAQEKLEEAGIAFTQIGNKLGAAWCLQSLGDILRIESNNSAAQEKLEKARIVFTQIGDRLGAAWCLWSLGDILLLQSNYSAAEEKLEEARIAFTQIGNKLGAAQCLKSLGDILRMQSNNSAAWEKLEEAGIAFTQIGNKLGAAWCLQSLGDILQMQRNYPAAEEKLEEARIVFTQIGNKLGAAWCLKSLGDILRMQSNNSAAEEKLEEARIAFTQIGNKLGAARCLWSLGDILRMQGNYSAAQEKFEEARAVFTHIEDKSETAWCLWSLGNVLFKQGNYSVAYERLEEARALFTQIGNDQEAAECLLMLSDILLQSIHGPTLSVWSMQFSSTLI